MAFRLAALSTLVLLAAAAAAAQPARSPGAPSKPCRTVVKKVGGKKKRVRVCKPADLAVTVTASPQRVTAGNEVVLTIRVANRGPGEARGVRVTARLGGASPRGIFPPVACGLTKAADVACPLGRLGPPRRGGIVVLALRVRPPDPGTLRLGARVTSSTRDPRAGNNVANAALEVAPGPPSADLSAVTTPPAAPVAMGDDFHSAVTVRNDGPTEATGVAVMFHLPAGLTIADVSAPAMQREACDYGVVGIQSAVCLGTLEPGASTTIDVTAMAGPHAALTLTQLFVVTASTPDPDLTDNAAAATVAVTPFTALPGAELGLSVTPSTTSTRAGGPIAFTAVVKNLGLDPARALRVSFSFTGPFEVGTVGIEHVPEAEGTSGCALAAVELRCTVGSLPSGERWTVEAVGRALRPGTVTAAVTAASSTPDPHPANNAATVTVEVG